MAVVLRALPFFQRNGLRDCPLGNTIQQQHGECDQKWALRHELILLGCHFLFLRLLLLGREKDFT